MPLLPYPKIEPSGADLGEALKTVISMGNMKERMRSNKASEQLYGERTKANEAVAKRKREIEAFKYANENATNEEEFHELMKTQGVESKGIKWTPGKGDEHTTEYGGLSFTGTRANIGKATELLGMNYERIKENPSMMRQFIHLANKELGVSIKPGTKVDKEESTADIKNYQFYKKNQIETGEPFDSFDVWKRKESKSQKDERTTEQKDYEFYVKQEKEAGKTPMTFGKWKKGETETEKKAATRKDYEFYVEQEKTAGRTPATFGEFRKDEKKPAKVQTAQWLIDQKIVANGKEAWALIQTATEKSLKAFVMDAAVRLAGMGAGQEDIEEARITLTDLWNKINSKSEKLEPQAEQQKFLKTATNPKTGEKIGWNGKEWIPIK